VVRRLLKKFISPGPTWQYRLAAFSGEVIVIVTGIVLGLAVENYKEELERHEKSQELLVSMHEELERDVLELLDDSAAIHQKVLAYRAFFKLGAPGQEFDAELVSANTWSLGSTTTFIPNTTVYEVMKAHGGLEIWDDNHHVLTEIFNLYQEQVPLIQMSNKACNELLTQDLMPYMRGHLELDANGTILNLHQILQANNVRVLLMNLSDYCQEAEYRYGATIKAYRKLIRIIEQEVGQERLKESKAVNTKS